MRVTGLLAKYEDVRLRRCVVITTVAIGVAKQHHTPRKCHAATNLLVISIISSIPLYLFYRRSKPQCSEVIDRIIYFWQVITRSDARMGFRITGKLAC